MAQHSVKLGKWIDSNSQRLYTNLNGFWVVEGVKLNRIRLCKVWHHPISIWHQKSLMQGHPPCNFSICSRYAKYPVGRE